MSDFVPNKRRLAERMAGYQQPGSPSPTETGRVSRPVIPRPAPSLARCAKCDHRGFHNIPYHWVTAPVAVPAGTEPVTVTFSAERRFWHAGLQVVILKPEGWEAFPALWSTVAPQISAMGRWAPDPEKLGELCAFVYVTGERPEGLRVYLSAQHYETLTHEDWARTEPREVTVQNDR